MEVITSGQIYWLTRCDAIRQALECNGGFIAFAVLGLFITCLFTVVMCCIRDGVVKYEKKGEAYESEAMEAKAQLALVSGVRKIGIALFCVFLPLWLGSRLLHPFIPTTKELAAIVVIPKIANSESVQGIGQSIVDLAKDWMAELRPQDVKKTVKAVKKGIDSTADKVREAAKEVAK